jgi:hypothetical protein
VRGRKEIKPSLAGKNKRNKLSCEKIKSIHKAQLLTYLKLSGLKLGLLLNFNVPVMRDGIIRMVHELEE